MKESFVGGFVLTVSNTSEVVIFRIEKTDTAEFELDEHQIVTKFSGTKLLWQAILPVFSSLEMIINEDIEMIESLTEITTTNDSIYYLPNLLELRMALEIEVLPNLIPDYVNSKNKILVDMAQEFLKSVPNISKDITKQVIKRLADEH